MYTREILPPRASPVEDGNPVFGTWDRAFNKIDLLEIRRPYSFPLPKWARSCRIKEREIFSVSNDELFLGAVFCNEKLYRILCLLFYDKKSGEKLFLKNAKPGAGWSLPQNISCGYADGSTSGFNFSINTNLNTGNIKLNINNEGAMRRPLQKVNLEYNLNQGITPLTVSLGIAGRRIMCAYKAFAPVQGSISFKDRCYSLGDKGNSYGFFCDYKGFLPSKIHRMICSGTGFDEKHGRFAFHIAENQTRESNKNNENVLWINGKTTPLPPVLITMPNGPDAERVIQDVEGMVDLIFTPKDINKSAEYNSFLGVYNGMLADSEGRQILIKNLFGTGERFLLRV